MQVYFLEAIACPRALELYDVSFGRPTAGMREGLREATRAILRARRWPVTLAGFTRLPSGYAGGGGRPHQRRSRRRRDMR